MAILYQTTEFKFANTFEMAIWDPIAKSNSHQYFWLYYPWSGNMGKYSALWFCIVPPFSWANTATLKLNIPHIALPVVQ